MKAEMRRRSDFGTCPRWSYWFLWDGYRKGALCQACGMWFVFMKNCGFEASNGRASLPAALNGSHFKSRRIPPLPCELVREGTITSCIRWKSSSASMYKAGIWPISPYLQTQLDGERAGDFTTCIFLGLGGWTTNHIKPPFPADAIGFPFEKWPILDDLAVRMAARPLQSSFCWRGKMPLQAAVSHRSSQGKHAGFTPIQFSEKLISAICLPMSSHFFY